MADIPQPRNEVISVPLATHGALDYGELAKHGIRPQDVVDFSENSNPFGPSPRVREALAQAVAGNKVMDISRAVQRMVEAGGLHVVREYTGHGVGRQMHEAPQVLNYVGGDADGNYVLEAGVVIAIEPMVQQGTWQTRALRDGWTVVSKDGSLSAHFEHTVAVTNSGPEILTLL